MMDFPPHIRLLLKLQQLGQAVDYQDRAGIPGVVTIRHARNRNAVRAEKPAMSLILVSDDDRPNEEEGRNDFEQVREMVVDLQADLELPTEVSRSDVTGLGYLSLFVAAFVGGLRDPDQPNRWLDGLCDWLRVGALEPDDRSTPEDGRMTRAIHVVYRVRTDDPNVLLADGENG